ncbi:MAG: ATP-binding protein [Bacteroidales bacterium]|jgi:predicted ATPase|nr:ATP-binding protein [Bacteroidales bacterium]
MTTTIKIRNIGPIREADLSLNKINVFMGQQSSGKSTIAKIISYCTWVEKDVATSQSLKTYQDNRHYFIEQLESFHKLKGYFKNQNRYISFQSDVVKIEYSDKQFSIDWTNRYAYQRSKLSYIPSERNMIILPEVKKVTFDSTNIRSFMFDWFDEKKNYSKENTLSILNLDLEYYYDENSDEDHILHKQNGELYDILLSNASSGLQSITPLIATIDYLTNGFYSKDENISFELLEEKIRKTNQILVEELILKKYSDENTETGKEKMDIINEKLIAKDEQVLRLVEEYDKVRKMLFSAHDTLFIIEEPEQNLFPKTQRDLVYYLLNKCVDNERNHRLTITTHSPYILYALNNCMIGKIVFDKMDDEDKSLVVCKSALINPDDVSIYQIEKGKLVKIQQEDGLIGSNYFDEEMKELMDDYYTFLKYYDDDGA